MESVKAHFKNAVTLGEDFVDRNPTPCLTKHTKELETRFGGSRATWFLGVLSFVCIVLFLIGGLGIIANLVGFLYPAYATFKAIDSPDAHASMQWLSYWAIFGLFYVLETPPFSFALSIIPFYSMLKLGFLIYCFHPYTRGASVAYTTLVSPALAPYLGQAGVGGRVKVPSRVPVATSGAPSKASGGSAASTSAASMSRGSPTVVMPPADDLRAPEMNELKVLVVSARNLVETVDPAASVDCDPYCVLEVVPEPPRPRSGAAESTKYKTVCKGSTANPIWNESVIIPQVENLDAKLVVSVANKRALGSDQHLGKVEVPLSDPRLRAPGGEDMEMKLSPAADADGAFVSGDLRLVVTLK